VLTCSSSAAMTVRSAGISRYLLWGVGAFGKKLR